MAQIDRSNNWKDNLVLIAKNTFVWLYQLSEKYGSKIERLDQVPIEELEQLRELGINGIWLIGIWERSPASRKIKSLYGFERAAASAYSIYAYQITQLLGGRNSFLKFRDLARSVGIRIGCDMVPNHTGIDSPWVISHPEWFIQADANPSNHFIFTSPDLSLEPSKEIRIENGYYTRTGAAEVFSYLDVKTGKEEFIYHGNDGTSMPWNDTAQLNYLNPEVRKIVRATILEVASDFDIIRLDAAMTLTRQHYKRLWFPGDDGQRCIPTREKNRMSDADFDRRMPEEFWSLVVEDIKQKAPDTLLIAEAFWLMEGYFIKHIMMDRVYNSAFMNMMKNEENRKFKFCLNDMQAIKPNALDHLVNYQTTPDEESAINQFGAEDKYFGVSTLMCTLPGLPMFGHGQFDGYRERYGMDYLVPHMYELPNQKLREKHQQLLSPLLHNRLLFASAARFRLLELTDEFGNPIDDAILYTNSYDGQHALVIYNNSPRRYSGTLPVAALLPGTQNVALISLRDDAGNPECKQKTHAGKIQFDLSPYASGAFLLKNTMTL